MTTNSESENANHVAGAVISAANQLGKGFDIFGIYRLDSDSTKSQLIDLSKVTNRDVNFLNKVVSVPEIMTLTEERTTNAIDGTVETREAFQNKFAMNVGVSGSAGFFSGQFSFAYSKESDNSTDHKYSFKSVSTALGSLVMDDVDEDVLKPKIKREMEALNLDWKKDYKNYELFFNDFGTHFVYKVDLGVNLEMYTSVKNSSSLSKTDIEACFKAQYDGLFATGSFSVDSHIKEAFQKYQSNSSTKITGVGGDVSLLLQLADNPPFKGTVDLYHRWTNSIASNPASMNFRLKGIWMLCKNREKRVAMELAFKEYAKAYRLKGQVESRSTRTGFYIGPNLIPEPPKPAGNAGFQGWRFTVLDRKDLSTIILNEHFGYDPTVWRVSAKEMYTKMSDTIKAKGLNNDKYLWILSTYGVMFSVAPPSDDFFHYLKTAGGGKQLLIFEDLARHSSSLSNHVRYSLIGVPTFGIGTGVESYVDNHGMSKDPAPDMMLNVLMYRSPIDKLYSIGVDPNPQSSFGVNNAEETGELDETGQIEA